MKARQHYLLIYHHLVLVSRILFLDLKSEMMELTKIVSFIINDTILNLVDIFSRDQKMQLVLKYESAINSSLGARLPAATSYLL